MAQIETLVAGFADLMHADAERLSADMRSIGMLPPRHITIPAQEETGVSEPMARGSTTVGSRVVPSSELLTVTDAASRSSFYAVPNDPYDGPAATALFFLLPDPRD